MMTDTVYDVAIIGAGPAGLTAALYCGRANLSTVMFGNIFDSQLAKAGDVENYPGFDSIKGIVLVERFYNQLQKYQIVFMQSFIVRIKREDLFTLFTESTEVKCKSVIIATGSKYKQLKVPGEEEFNYKGVSYCSVCDGSFYKGKQVAVIGEGDRGAKSALYLAGLCKDVYLFTKKIELEAPTYDEQVKAVENIHVITGAKILSIEGHDYVENLRYMIEGGKESMVRVDGIFIEGGVPNSVLAKELELQLDQKGYILVSRPDHTTNIEGVFAAGDITGGIHQISKAVGEGACAAVSAALYLKKRAKKENKGKSD